MNWEDELIDTMILKQLLRNLKLRHKKIIYLHFYRGFSFLDIAKQLGMSYSNVMRLRNQAFTAMRRDYVRIEFADDMKKMLQEFEPVTRHPSCWFEWDEHDCLIRNNA
jgi:DNA-directed RNA polymerase specialized sigma24 family protein